MGARHDETTPSLAPGIIADAFARAIAAATDYAGATSPNPPVGCVLLDAFGDVLAVEAHRKAGDLHAEARAIAASRAAGTIDRIHTVVVTLEPCNHHGRTPPCAEAILATSAREVWIAETDPNPHVEGGGAVRLAAAGLTVRFLKELNHPDNAHLVAEAERLIAPFAKWTTTGLPFVTVKQALDETGSMIPPKGQRTFTSETSLTLAHRMRRRADAILTGNATILADNPEFTVRRLPDHPGKARILAILDRTERVPADYLAEAARRGLRPMLFADIGDALAHLGSEGVHEVLVEAGPTLTDAILSTDIWDEHVAIKKSGDGSPDHITTSRNHTKKG
ncbi:bifunctional diaminohydroxyphosphoribosylaminopyrimidine deaminase/5-amino-6-(5-phosphoribosylamino)uracil reductase RibD [Pleomorphomonas diazotrophica]|uniref:Riboflavin biosynthesis protein RibD n=1 Tax=Pleomorphomonas diazotrophica TaxID=1166257 RepID=A0A1I4QML0_9HYPH|nr:bifunctional diaminohydroxyphosphoribosylaminopyrimidine deaminase/5-amino-6-(5-phosphoribosylamino)uracil reductase RibD [Pleomorphomonas diazotrophica]PKR90559.1 bifunctional diaminohydroxyphosphoribosylaminopyrimidine deaminase/5-amino-6-(5-phosphoribosylamino)uracil reductase RibD [Pleomorphomonas diazotrophica]SFM41259.1 diaminohydroxyphosphoribosylaminopyrimidine deaminase [Pleomorphomonas diazotrophica]